MRSLFLSTLIFSTALGVVVPRAGKKIDYNGFKLLRVSLSEGAEDVEAQIEELAAHVLNPGKTAHLDVVVSPSDADAVTALAATSTVLNEDVGAALAEEGELAAYEGGMSALAGSST